MPKLERFTFDVRPTYPYDWGKMVEIHVRFGGTDYVYAQTFDEIARPWESLIDRLAERAVEELKRNMKAKYEHLI